MKKTILLCMILVLALGLMGASYAKWSDTVAINADVETGTLKWGFVNNSYMGKDVGSDWTCDTGLRNVRPAVELKDVGNTTGVLLDTDNDGVLDVLEVTVNNAYPCYYNELSVKVENFGTIPFIIQNPVLYWKDFDNCKAIENGATYLLYEDGTIAKWDGQAGDIPGVVMEFRWMDNVGYQQHPGIQLEDSFDFHIHQFAQQGTTYKFWLMVEAVQWNEGRPLTPPLIP